MELAHCTEPPLPVVDLPQQTQKREPATKSPLLLGRPLDGLVHYIPVKDREARVNRHKVEGLKDQRPLTSGLHLEIIIFESCLLHRDQF